MQITLSRKHTNSLYTEGELLINGKHYADTVESTDTMAAPGVYTISKRLDDYIGHGNSWRESRKTRKILIGRCCFPGIVTSSRPLYDRLFTRFRKGKKPVLFIITDSKCSTTKPISHWLSAKAIANISVVFSIIVSVILCSLTACSTLHRTQVVQHSTHDTILVNTLHYDSIYVDNRQVIDRSNDTVVIREFLRENHYKLLKDTIRISKIDTIPVIHEVEVIKTERYIPSVYKWSLGIFIFFIIIALVIITIRVIRANSIRL